jgi:putative tricarboxylic transport membrane protein
VVAVVVLSLVVIRQGYAGDINSPECIAPARPGGGFDLTCRVAQVGLADELEAPLRVTFMPGEIGAVAFALFNTSRTDDPNAIVAFSSGSLLNIATGKFGPWEEDGVRFLATVGLDFGAVAVPNDSPFETLPELMAEFERDPSSMAVGAGGGVGSQDWIKAALLLKSIKHDPREMIYLVYDGGGDAIMDLIDGRLDVLFGDTGELVGYLGHGSLRVLSVMSAERLPAPFDQIPTAKELGYDAEWEIMRGFYMGKNVPNEVYDAWVAKFNAAYEKQSFANARAAQGLLPLSLAGKELDEVVKAHIQKLQDIAVSASELME